MNPINPVCRPATENEINYGEAKWCAKCTSECDSKGKDELVVCDYFKTNDNDPIVPGCPSLMPHALPGGLDVVAPAEEGTPLPEPKDFAAKRRREMSNKQETIADIVAEMINEARAGDGSCLEWVAEKMRSYADRIEAAAKREREATREKSSQVGNAAEMRDALDKIYNKLETLDVEEDSYADEIIASVKSDIVDALSATPRNCDMYTTLDDARNSFFADYVSDETCSSATAFAIWLFDKAKG